MEKVVICYGSSAVKLKERIDEINSYLLDVLAEWGFTSQQLVTNFTEKDNFFIRLNLLDDLDSATTLLAFAKDVVKCMHRFILSSEVNFVTIC